MAPREGAYAQIIALALTNVILIAAALFFPFLAISASGIGQSMSLLDAALAFATGGMWPFAIATAALIFAIPLMRLGAIIYTVIPLLFGNPPFKHAKASLRLAIWLEPWAMAEIFVLGACVALIKVADLATITFGVGFWALAALVLITVLQDNFMSRHMLWKTLHGADTHA